MVDQASLSVGGSHTFKEITWNYPCLQHIDLHLVSLSEGEKVRELVLKDRLIGREVKTRDFMHVRGTNNRGSWEE